MKVIPQTYRRLYSSKVLISYFNITYRCPEETRAYPPYSDS
jgi:hypothetical protein